MDQASLLLNKQLKGKAVVLHQLIFCHLFSLSYK